MAYVPELIADLHTHILPAVDHGSQSTEESIKMLRASYESGIRYIAATHHYYVSSSAPADYLKKRDEAAKRLSQSCDGLDVPALVLGTELAYFKNMSGMFDLSPFCYQGSRYILIEPPYSEWESSFFNDIDQIILRQELIPVIAHVERFTKVAPKKYAEILTEIGAVLQYNAEYFLHNPKKAIKRIPKDAKVVFGSDMHNMTDRAPNLYDALKGSEKYMPEEFFESARDVTEKIFGL